ncbi:MAG: peptidoglycan DD-metalloendopeptidase family protein [Pseudomonadota bacterium]
MNEARRQLGAPTALSVEHARERARPGTPLFLLGLLTGGALTALSLGIGGGLGSGSSVSVGKAHAKTPDAQILMSAELASLEDTISTLEMERNEANQRRQEAARRLADAEARLREATLALSESDAALGVALTASASAERAQRALAVEADAAADQTIALRTALGEAEKRSEALEVQIGTFGALIDDVIAERDFALAREDRLGGEVALLETRLAAATDRERQLVAELTQAAEQSITGLEAVFERADVDLDRIVRELGRDFMGRGGPADDNQSLAPARPETAEDVELAALSSKLDRVNLMEFAATKVPFALPVRGGRLTSAFGPRRDPFHRRKVSMHQGIDIAAPHGTPIFATAEGIVTFVGRQRGYGIVVEIRHAFGFETLYAHLSKARVKLGQRVERGTRVGDMGSTGRSTGNHLHYEVRINSKAVNPMKFIEAARDVL